MCGPPEYGAEDMFNYYAMKERRMDEKAIAIIAAMEIAKQALDLLKADSQFDGRAVSIAITNLETAMLWVANARKDE
jgi:hypothetical protein